ncbi:hypothetical protein, partial [Synechococcus sp. BS55D]|uniref:hypothetical protein n=1 Tax=Synechococcus sp. BS55D TaxID=2055943 RepID=UPI001F4036D7
MVRCSGDPDQTVVIASVLASGSKSGDLEAPLRLRIGELVGYVFGLRRKPKGGRRSREEHRGSES